MLIQTICPKCGKLLRLDVSAADSIVRCPVCGAGVQVSARTAARSPQARTAAKPSAANQPAAANQPGDEHETQYESDLGPPDLTTPDDPWGDTDGGLAAAPALPPVEQPIDMRWVWKLSLGAVAVVAFATVVIVAISFFHRPPWDQAHKDDILALISRAEDEAAQNQPEAAYGTYRELDKLTEGHMIDDPFLQEKLADAKAARAKAYEQMLASNKSPDGQAPSAPAAPQPTVATPARPAVAQASPPPPAAPSHPAVRPPVPETGRVITDELVGRAISHGVDYLLDCFEPDGTLKKDLHLEHEEATDALIVYALLQCGHAIHDERLSLRSPFMPTAIDVLKKAEMKDKDGQTYGRSLRLQALSLGGRAEDDKQAQADLEWLLATPRAGGYTYGARDDRAPDSSNSQYGMLGVWAAAEAGRAVPPSYWRLVERYWSATELATGQWPYHAGDGPNANMSTAGINALFVTHDYLDPVEFTGAVGRPPFTPDLAAGLEWLENGDNCLFNGGGEYARYGLYGLERVGLASGFKFFGTHEWFRELGVTVLGAQDTAGSWEHHPVTTSFCLLFLSRGRHPLMMNKLRFEGDVPTTEPAAAGKVFFNRRPGVPPAEAARRAEAAAKLAAAANRRAPGYWANRPRDLANLARYASVTMERPVNWQVVPLDRDWKDWTDAPVLYLASHEPPPFKPADEDKLRQYVLNGGLLLTQADADSPSFSAWAEKLGTRLFPDYGWTDLPADDPLFGLALRVKNPPPVRAISNGSRLLFVHLPKDVSRYWQARDDKRHPDAFALGVNLFEYASGKTDFRNRLVTTYVPPAEKPAAAAIKVAELVVGGDRPEPAALPRFARWFRQQTDLDVQVVPAALEGLTPAVAPLAHLTGVSKFAVTDAQAKGLRDFVEGGGVVLIDPCGGPNDFDQSVREELLPKAFPAAQLAPVPITHPLLNDSGNGMAALGAPEVRPFSRGGTLPHGRAFEMLRSGKGCVVLAPMDVTSGLLGTNTWGVAGFSPEYALAFTKNWVLWTWDGAKDQ